MSGTAEDPIPGFPAIGQYELTPGPGEPGFQPLPEEVQSLPEGVEVVYIDDPAALHDAIAAAVGEGGGDAPFEDPNDPEDDDDEEEEDEDDEDDDDDDDDDEDDSQSDDAE